MNEIILPITPIVMLFFALKRSCREGLLITLQVLIWSVLLFTFSFPLFSSVAYLSDNSIFLFYTAYASLIFLFLFFNDAKWLSLKLNKHSKYSLDKVLITLLSNVFLLILIFEIAYVIISSGGVYSALTRNRLEDYLGGGILSGSFMSLVLLLPKIGYFIKVGYLLDKGKNGKAFYLVLVYVVYFIFTANTRLPIIMPIASFFVLYLFFNYKSKIQHYGLILAVLAIIILNVLLVIGNSLRGGTAGELNVNSQAIISQNSEQLKYPLWINELVNDIDNGEIELSHGYAWVITPFVNLVPRVIWPGKPLTSTSNILSENVYGITVGDGKPITTFTIWGEGYWQFKLLGVFFSTLLFFLLACFFISIITKFKHSSFFVVYFLCNITPFVRAETPAFMVLTNLIALGSIIFMSYVLRRFYYV